MCCQELRDAIQAMQAAMDPAELRKRSRQELEQLVLKADAIIQAKDKGKAYPSALLYIILSTYVV